MRRLEERVGKVSVTGSVTVEKGDTEDLRTRKQLFETIWETKKSHESTEETDSEEVHDGGNDGRRSSEE